MNKTELMYREIVLEHYKNPQNYGTLLDYDLSNKEDNPLCGDEIGITIKLNNNTIFEIKFDGHGCAISQAAASILISHVKGKTLDEVKNLSREDMLKFFGVEITPMRLKCVLLAWNVLQNAINNYGEKNE